MKLKPTIEQKYTKNQVYTIKQSHRIDQETGAAINIDVRSKNLYGVYE